MTLYAPPTDGQACRLIARRLLMGRPAVMALCLTALVSSVVTSGHSIRGSAIEDRNGAEREIRASPEEETPSPAIMASVALPVPAAFRTLQDLEVLSGFDNAETMIRAAIAANHPRFRHSPLPDTALQSDAHEDDAPGLPGAAIRMASLAPPSARGDYLGDSLFPRMPEAASLSIVPPVLSTRDQRDSLPSLDTASDAAMPAGGLRTETVRAVGGETLAHLLDRFEIEEDDRRATLVALRADSIAETLVAGDRVDLAFRPNREPGRNKLIGIRLQFDDPAGEERRKVELRWDGEIHDLWASVSEDDGLVAAAEDYRPVTTSEALGGHALGIGEPERVFLQGVVETSLYQAADDAGMTPGESKTLTDVFRYLVDFERDLRRGDRFEVLFDKKENGDYGDIVYAMIENRGRQIALYRGQTGTDSFEYFDRDGKTNKRALMRTPLAYSRISSNYGMRRHPIDGYRKMHKGVDFSASRGTPIVAAGNGTVEYVGRRGGYGKYIRIRHNRTYKTAYAHLSKYAPSIKSGARVQQGDVIGYVGSTGRSTGPHLHFEVLENGKQVNPMKVGDFGPIRSLTGADLARFKAGTARISLVLAQLRPKTVVAAID